MPYIMFLLKCRDAISWEGGECNRDIFIQFIINCHVCICK